MGVEDGGHGKCLDCGERMRLIFSEESQDMKAEKMADGGGREMGRVLPILFNTDMVQAILDGRKTVTRRVVKKSQCMLLDRKEPYELDRKYAPFDSMTDRELIKSTYKEPYKPGDTLYVRETWSFLPCIECMDEGPACNVNPVVYDDGDCESEGCFVYKASHPRPERVSWTPSIHMPKQAARIWLKVTTVRVERLQDIDDEGAKTEGANWKNGKHVGFEEKLQRSSIERFAEIWDSTIKKNDLESYGWEANPWVWVIEFKRCEKPITFRN